MPNSVTNLPGDCTPDDIIECLEKDGVVIINDFVSEEWRDSFNNEIAPYMVSNRCDGYGADGYQEFFGDETIRLHGLCAKAPSFVDLFSDKRLLTVADNQLSPYCSSFILSAGELIDIGPSESVQDIHHDNGSWPAHAWRQAKVLTVNTIVALSPFTEQNGATHVVPGSHLWPEDRTAEPHEIKQAVMPANSAVFLRGDVLHFGGANKTTDQRRRGLSVAYCLGWLRPVENSYLNLPLDVVRKLPSRAQQLLGYDLYNGVNEDVPTGVLGFYEMGDPAQIFAT